ncbi:MAG: hypothetical protein QOE68_3236 [Thermoanaerobaculia bacterium]|nr:hypothetical protein [Thermoanaerobaculia bacterium]
MRRLVAVAIVLLAACSQPETTVVTDTRQPIAIRYVGAPEAAVHKWATDGSPVIAKFLNGEGVSVLARKGDWLEVRTAGASGFVHAADLTDATEAQKERDNPNPKFRNIPSPVTAPGVKGSVYIEANVNTEGEITSTTIISNTTGSDELGQRNAAALERARFYPIVVRGDRKPFIYYYRVDY